MKAFIAATLAILLSTEALAAWPVLPKGTVICTTRSSATEQAHATAQGIEDIINKHCGKTKMDLEYRSTGAMFIRDSSNEVVATVIPVTFRKNNSEAYILKVKGE